MFAVKIAACLLLCCLSFACTSTPAKDAKSTKPESVAASGKGIAGTWVLADLPLKGIKFSENGTGEDFVYEQSTYHPMRSFRWSLEDGGAVLVMDLGVPGQKFSLKEFHTMRLEGNTLFLTPVQPGRQTVAYRRQS